MNQLLAKLDGVVAAPNVLVVGCTNRPELIDEALLRPGRLEIQLVVDRPDAAGRRAIARIHTRQMRENGALAADAAALVEDGGSAGLAARTELFSGAELAGLVRAAASFALQRPEKTVTEADLDRALREVRPAAATAGAALEARLDRGFAADLACQAGARRRLARSVDAALARPGVRSLLLVPDVAGCGATALASKAARDAVRDERAGAAELASADDLLRDGARPGAALAAAFATAAAAEASILVLDDVDALVGGDGSALAVLRALCRRPPPPGNRLLVLATAAAPGVDAALDACFDEVLRVPRGWAAATTRPRCWAPRASTSRRWATSRTRPRRSRRSSAPRTPRPPRTPRTPRRSSPTRSRTRRVARGRDKHGGVGISACVREARAAARARLARTRVSCRRVATSCASRATAMRDGLFPMRHFALPLT